MKKRTVASDEAVKGRNALGFEPVLNQYIIVDGKYLNRVLPRCLDQPSVPKGGAREPRRVGYALSHVAR